MSSSSESETTSSDSSSSDNESDLSITDLPSKGEIIASAPMEEQPTIKKKPFWAPKHIAFIKGLPFAASPDEIKNFLADCGEITSLTRQLGIDGRWTGCVFAKFSNRADLDTALTLDGTVWTGSGGDGSRFVKVVEHKGKEKKKKSAGSVHTVFVGNISKETTENELKDAFLEFGTIKRVSFAKDSAGAPRGFGHVEFDEAEGKESAIKMNRKVDLNGCSLTVRKATIGGSKNKKSGANKKKEKVGVGEKKEDGEKKMKKRKRAGKGRFKGKGGEGGESSVRSGGDINRSDKKPRASA